MPKSNALKAEADELTDAANEFLGLSNTRNVLSGFAAYGVGVCQGERIQHPRDRATARSVPTKPNHGTLMARPWPAHGPYMARTWPVTWPIVKTLYF